MVGIYMGKVRVKTFDESGELQDDKKRAKYEAKKAERNDAARQAKPAVSETPSVEVENESSEIVIETTETVKKNPKQKFAGKAVRDSKRHLGNNKLVEKNKKYALPEAISLLKNFKKSTFDETVELHLNVSEKGINGQVTLPHGTGKKLRIVVADDAVIAAVEAGKIEFDVLVAKPEMMPKLAKIARVLGPRGLMPNPKNGTVTPNTDEAIEKLSAGQITYKTEAKDPIMHLMVGKISFDEKQLEENITTYFSSIGTSKIKSATLKSTMSPGIKISC
jgi:large subunit ribosomal protein L1